MKQKKVVHAGDFGYFAFANKSFVKNVTNTDSSCAHKTVLRTCSIVMKYKVIGDLP